MSNYSYILHIWSVFSQIYKEEIIQVVEDEITINKCLSQLQISGKTLRHKSHKNVVKAKQSRLDVATCQFFYIKSLERRLIFCIPMDLCWSPHQDTSRKIVHRNTIEIHDRSIGVSWSATELPLNLQYNCSASSLIVFVVSSYHPSCIDYAAYFILNVTR
jgi:hypothetical protein